MALMAVVSARGDMATGTINGGSPMELVGGTIYTIENNVTIQAGAGQSALTVKSGTGAAGNEIYNLMVSADRPKTNGLNTYWRNSWRNPGDNAKYADPKQVASKWEYWSSSAAVFDGSFHEVDSSEMAFKIAASMALKDGAKKANPVILEPIMKVEVVAPEANLGDIIGDLSSRRGQIGEMGVRGNVRYVRAEVPLAEMFGYATNVRSLSQGRASFTMEPSHYAEVPANVAKAIVEKRTAAKAATAA